ncbi:zinc transporter ZIP11-like isoform X2 [Halichondria panicea]|uniref:zinc transporter ZIP11-like isoform X2 n=1 Tax=Halichondria panicea TaxID=6063 RepID=UPI00312BB5AB
MLSGYHPLIQALLGTLLTWGLTAAGAALVFVLQTSKQHQRKILDASLGFAAGVMLAASYWSLLAPAIEMASESGMYGSLIFLPIAVGFVAGAVFVYLADLLLPLLGVHSSDWSVAYHGVESSEKRRWRTESMSDAEEGDPDQGSSPVRSVAFSESGEHVRRRLGSSGSGDKVTEAVGGVGVAAGVSWRRILLLIIAITVHNIPEGLAVGVAFGAIGKSPSATLDRARSLTLGIGIQNFPEGLAVSLPLRAAGMDVWKSFWYGQLSGMVEPLAGLLGALSVVVAEPLLPYALAFAAGAMVYVVADDIIPEAHSSGNGRLSSIFVVVGFIVMMSLDVGLG